jgi:threonine dehydrogenase-like Zn-dependent dehydrogenase
VRPRTLEPVVVPDPDSADLDVGQIIVKAEIGSLCGTDLPRWGGSEWTELPARPGFPLHECVGAVVASRSERIRVGERVVALPDADAGLCELFVSDQSRAAIVPDDLAPETAVLAQPVSTVLWAVERLGDISGKRVLLIGHGSMGHLAGWQLARAGAEVAAVDQRAVAAPEWGIGKAYRTTSSELSVDEVGEVDLTVEIVGHQEQTLLDAARLTRHRGTVLAFGVPRPGAELPFSDYFHRNLDLVSSVTPILDKYLSAGLREVAAAPDLLSSLVTAVYSWSEVPNAYEAYAAAAPGRLKIQVDLRETVGTL